MLLSLCTRYLPADTLITHVTVMNQTQQDPSAACIWQTLQNETEDQRTDFKYILLFIGIWKPQSELEA